MLKKFREKIMSKKKLKQLACYFTALIFFSCLDNATYQDSLTHNDNPLTNGNTDPAIIEANNGETCDTNSSEKSLLITEIGYSYYINFPIWIEIYNPSTKVENLCGYSLKSLANDGVSKNLEVKKFPLPSKAIKPKGHVIIRSDYQNNYSSLNKASSQIIYIRDNDGFYPTYSTKQGFFELLFEKNDTVDFVKFGVSLQTPSKSNEWEGAAASTFSTFIPEGYGQSISRKFDFDNLRYFDTQQASDWEIISYSTRGGVNDVTANNDKDGDGIPDSSEAPGKSFAGLPLYDWGARPGQKDIFIEVDYMAQGTGKFSANKITPERRSLQKVKDAFARKGYAVHFDVGDLFDKNAADLNPQNMNLGGGNEIPFSPGIAFELTASGNTASFYEIKAENMAINRREIFYYMVIANSLKDDGSSGASGVAEFKGNDSIISLASFGYTGNLYINTLASTIMHEFGHNLGLDHGGNEDNNYKPNYLSVMNYLYFFGLPAIGNKEGDRYYLENYPNNNNCLMVNNHFNLQNSPHSLDDFVIDYSDGSGATIDERGPINEYSGLGRAGSAGVDFNCDGRIDSSLPGMNLNPKHTNTQEVLKDYNDWDNIQIIFRRNGDGGNYGKSLDETTSSFVPFDPIFQDNQQEITQEDEKLILGRAKSFKNHHHHHHQNHHHH